MKTDIMHQMRNDFADSILAHLELKYGKDAGAVALLRSLPLNELQDAYRLAKADETEKGQHSAWLIGQELIRRSQ